MAAPCAFKGYFGVLNVAHGPSLPLSGYSGRTLSRVNVCVMTLHTYGRSVEFNKQESDMGALHGWWQATLVQFLYVPELSSALRPRQG
jgi:hypothetical protein